jgi:hypothetical protein
MGLAAFNRMRREQGEKAKEPEQSDTPTNSAEPAKPARKPKAK